MLAPVSPTWALAEAAAAAPFFCAQPTGDEPVLEHLRAHHLLDAHQLAQTLLALCPSSPLRFRWKVLDALALDQLDEPVRARQALFDVANGGPPAERQTAAMLLARAHLAAGDDDAFRRALASLPPHEANRLLLFQARDNPGTFLQLLTVPTAGAAPTPSDTLLQVQVYDRARHTRRPWLAGTLSAVLPGAGQVYAGSWQGGAVAFVLNAVLIGATVELAYHHLYASASAAGVAASIFYVGNILNGADLAARRNEQAARPAEEALERLLVPEAYP